ncbi:MAG: hypothetical protein KA801_00710 [Syntrophorhabdaceae bacterium]|nr:hypothetical protein [Syntrophorhabdaceae bacterium]
MIVMHCLKVAGGIIVPVYMEAETALDKVTDQDISISVSEYGIDVRIKYLVIPVPEYMLEYLIGNNKITLYLADDSQYFWEPILAVEIPKNNLVEANGIYRYKQKQQGAVS